MRTIEREKIVWRYLNLSHRIDRLRHIRAQLEKVGIVGQRFNALRKEDYTGPPENVAMMQATPNTIGNYLSVLALYRTVIGTDNILGMLEDDALLCSDFQQRLQYIEDNFRFDWDVFFLGATVHVDEAPWHPELGKDCELTDVKHILRTYGAFSNQGYLINPDSSQKILEMMQERMPHSRGSDHALIQIQPQLNCYCFVPGMVFQIDGQSDIGDGITEFSKFRETLGPHVWADRLEEFDWDEWVEARR